MDIDLARLSPLRLGSYNEYPDRAYKHPREQEGYSSDVLVCVGVVTKDDANSTIALADERKEEI